MSVAVAGWDELSSGVQNEVEYAWVPVQPNVLVWCGSVYRTLQTGFTLCPKVTRAEIGLHEVLEYGSYEAGWVEKSAIYYMLV